MLYQKQDAEEDFREYRVELINAKIERALARYERINSHDFKENGKK
jgi:hypothetical protein